MTGIRTIDIDKFNHKQRSFLNTRARQRPVKRG
nr:MAG TPA: hypothetical protein [Caudoviricetes sp.]